MFNIITISLIEIIQPAKMKKIYEKIKVVSWSYKRSLCFWSCAVWSTFRGGVSIREVLWIDWVSTLRAILLFPWRTLLILRFFSMIRKGVTLCISPFANYWISLRSCNFLPSSSLFSFSSRNFSRLMSDNLCPFLTSSFFYLLSLSIL